MGYPLTWVPSQWVPSLHPLKHGIVTRIRPTVPRNAYLVSLDGMPMKTKAIFLMFVMVLSAFAGCVGESRDTPDDNRNSISGRVLLVEATVENTSADDNVTSALVYARLASGSENTTMDKISYGSDCNRYGEQVHAEAVYLTGETELKSGEYFEFIAEFSECTAALNETLVFWFAIDGVDGYKSSADLEVSSTEKGRKL